MTKPTTIVRACTVDYMLATAAVVVAILLHTLNAHAQNSLPPPAPSPPAAEPKQQPPKSQPGQTNTNRTKTDPSAQDSPPAPGAQPIQRAAATRRSQNTQSPASQAPFGELFFGDFFNGGANHLTAPGSILTNPNPSDHSWSPLSIKLTTSAVHTANGSESHVYYRSLDLLKVDSAGSSFVVGANNYAYAPNTATYESHIYTAVHGLIHYQDGLSLYNSGTFDGKGSHFAHAFGGTPVNANNIVLVESQHNIIIGSQRDYSIMDAFSKTTTPQIHQEIGLLVGSGPTVPLLQVTEVHPHSTPPTGTTTNQASPGNATLHYLQNSINGLYTVPIYLATNAVSINVISPSAGANGVQKLVDNSSPLPRDRLFFNYNYFANTTEIVNGQSISVNRMTPGFEKTVFDQRMSIEVRVPFATTIDDINLTGTTNTSNIQLGNQTTYLKGILFNNSQIAITSGMGVQLPTAAGVDMYSTPQPGGRTFDVLQIKNQAVHVLPFVAAVYAPDDRFYAQGVMQLDFAANGNRVNAAAIYPDIHYENGQITSYSTTTTGLGSTGSLNDTNYMYLSANSGYWIYKVRNRFEKGITGVAPTVELHYNQSLQRSDVVAGGYGNVSSPIENVSNVNGVIGVNTVIGHDKYLSAAYVAPLTSGTDRFFDGELRVMFNYYFGAPRVNPRFGNVPGQ